MKVREILAAVGGFDDDLVVVIETSDGTAYEVESVSLRPAFSSGDRPCVGLERGNEYEPV